MITEIVKTSSQMSPFIVGLIQVIKPTGLIEKEYLPLSSVAIGLMLSLTFIGFNLFGVAVGIVSGLISTCAYDAIKNGIDK